MKYVVLLGMSLAGGQTWAEGPFGREVTGKSLILGVDDCSSTKLVDQAVVESGINFVDGAAHETFGCEELRGKEIYSNGGVLEESCRNHLKVRCYADKSRTAVCVTNPREVALPKVYGDAGRVTDHRPRFDGLFVFSKSGSGFGRERSWRMDPRGCHPASANLNNPMDSEKECRSRLSAFVNGGNLYPGNISKERFCDGKTTMDKIGVIDRLHDCLDSYPQLRRSFLEDAKPPRAGPSPAQGERSSGTSL